MFCMLCSQTFEKSKHDKPPTKEGITQQLFIILSIVEEPDKTDEELQEKGK